MIEEAYSVEVRPSRPTVFRWHASFCDGRETAALLPNPGQKSTTIKEELVSTAAAIIRDGRQMFTMQQVVHFDCCGRTDQDVKQMAYFEEDKRSFDTHDDSE